MSDVEIKNKDLEFPKNNKELKDFFAANKDLSYDEMMKAVHNVFAEKEKHRQNERDDLKNFAENHKHLNNKEKSYKFIEYYYDNYAKDFGDYELLILMISRGKNKQEYQPILYSKWKENVKTKIENAGYSHSDFDTGEGRSEDIFSKDVSKTSRFQIPDFWHYERKERNTIDATLLRVAEWCNISGFEGYWNRLVHDIDLNVPFKIEEKYRHIQWLYSTCRSDYAIELMKSKLQLLTDIYTIPNDSEVEFPWEYVFYDSKNGNKHINNSAFVAAGIIFSIIRLGKKGQHQKLLTKAIEFLINVQMLNGGWKPFSNHDKPSIEVTALCIHALAIQNPNDYDYSKNKGVEWLYSEQDMWGMWFEERNPYVTSEFLTVLVLDAIELSEKNLDTLTFNFHRIGEDMPAEKKTSIIYNVKVKGGTNIIGDQSISDSSIKSEQNNKNNESITAQNNFWWIPRLIFAILLGLVISYISNKYLSFHFWDSFLSVSSMISAVLLLRNPVRRFYRVGWLCIGLFSSLNLLPQLDILFKVTESNSNGVINKLFKLGIQDEPMVSIALILLSGFLFWLDSKEK